ncbi:MAG: hypothetical protein ABWW69_04760 [Pyrodictiaceae archaeon]
MSFEWQRKAKEIMDKMEKLRKEVQTILLDEMCEARAYIDMAIACSDPEAKWKLMVIAADSILHRELMWAIFRATISTEMFLQDLLKEKIASTNIEELLEEVKRHRSIEDIAEASYSDILRFAEPGTSLYKLLKMLIEEEAKHKRIVDEIVSKLSSKLSEKAKESSKH